jgi:hypothetical protein
MYEALSELTHLVRLRLEVRGCASPSSFSALPTHQPNSLRLRFPSHIRVTQVLQDDPVMPCLAACLRSLTRLTRLDLYLVDTSHEELGGALASLHTLTTLVIVPFATDSRQAGTVNKVCVDAVLGIARLQRLHASFVHETAGKIAYGDDVLTWNAVRHRLRKNLPGADIRVREFTRGDHSNASFTAECNFEARFTV